MAVSGGLQVKTNFLLVLISHTANINNYTPHKQFFEELQPATSSVYLPISPTPSSKTACVHNAKGLRFCQPKAKGQVRAALRTGSSFQLQLHSSPGSQMCPGHHAGSTNKP
jgi:hypothetical protein